MWAGAAVHGQIVGLSQACVCEEAIMSGQDNDIQWYIARDGKQHGPLTDVEMRTFVAHSYLRASDLIWRPGMTEWQVAPAAFPDALPVVHSNPPSPLALIAVRPKRRRLTMARPQLPGGTPKLPTSMQDINRNSSSRCEVAPGRWRLRRPR